MLFIRCFFPVGDDKNIEKHFPENPQHKKPIIGTILFIIILIMMILSII